MCSEEEKKKKGKETQPSNIQHPKYSLKINAKKKREKIETSKIIIETEAKTASRRSLGIIVQAIVSNSLMRPSK